MNKAILVQGLLYGDEGKGRTVNDLVQHHQASIVVRFNGGAQAAHNVITRDGRHHTFQQFGSASFQSGVYTLLSKHMLINPITMLDEEARLQLVGVVDALSRVIVDKRAPILTPFHQNLNRMRELSRETPHGTCAHGIGELMLDKEEGRFFITAGDLRMSRPTQLLELIETVREAKLAQALNLPTPKGANDQYVFKRQLEFLQDAEAKMSILARWQQWVQQVEVWDIDSIAEAFKDADNVVFEGAQGVLLDENYGFAPYNTWSNTTFDNAIEILAETGQTMALEVQKIGVLRSMATRHGPGPLVTEDAGLTLRLPEVHNDNNAWQKGFRFGHLDLVALKYALEVIGGVNALALTHFDPAFMTPIIKVCTKYDFKGQSPFVLRKPEKVLSQGDLYSKFTAPLMHCTPYYEEVPYFDLKPFIADRLGAPVGLLSYGPRANERKIY